MNVIKLRQEKEKLELDIYKMLISFSENTGVNIKKINLYHWKTESQCISERECTVGEIKIELQL